MARLTAGVAGAVIAVALVLAGCTGSTRAHRPEQVVSGDAEVGRQLIANYGCGACHEVPGVPGAHGLVGPPLSKMGSRSFIAGALANNQANMVRWVTDPQGVLPGTAMPDLHVTADEAQQIAAYLEGLE